MHAQFSRHSFDCPDPFRSATEYTVRVLNKGPIQTDKQKRRLRWIAGKTAEMINPIRNNMLHGLKAPDDAADRELLERVNPIPRGRFAVGNVSQIGTPSD